MTKNHSIPWLRIGAESVAIVVSILLAFAIDAWWDQRADRIRLEGAIQNVVTEVVENRSEIERACQRNEGRSSGLRRFLSLDPDELLALSPDAAMDIGVSFSPPSPFDPGGIALQALMAGGNLDILADEELGGALIAWAQFPDEIDDDYRAATEYLLLVFERTAQHGGVRLAVMNARLDPGFAFSTVEVSGIRPELAVLGSGQATTDG